MPQHDLLNDVTPKNTNRPPVGPTVAALKSALSTYNSTSYPATYLNTATKNDLIYAAKLHGLSVAGL